MDEQELELILNLREKAVDPALRESALAQSGFGMSESEKSSVEPCPKCSKPMMQMNWGGSSGVIIDRCVGHGLWFDAGELEKVQAIHEHWEDEAGRPEFRAEIQKRLDHEAVLAREVESGYLLGYGPYGRRLIKFLMRVLGG